MPGFDGPARTHALVQGSLLSHSRARACERPTARVLGLRPLPLGA